MSGRNASAATLNKQWLKDDHFVLATESDLRLAMELNACPGEFRVLVREIIRAGSWMGLDIEKQRLIDSFGGMQPESSQPGNALMARVLREACQQLEPVAAKGRKSRERYRKEVTRDLVDILKYIKKQFDFISSLDDPERQMERQIEGRNVTTPKPTNHKA